MKRFLLVFIAGIMCNFIISAQADELVLGENGKSNYQIVIPDKSADQAIEDCLKQTARLIQTAFKENGIELPIVKAKDRDNEKPCIYLGNTAFARANGVDTSKLEGWSYVMKVVGPDLIIAGHDHAPPEVTDPELKAGRRARFYYRLGTLKAVTDFLRIYAGTYFLYPGNDVLPSENSKIVKEWNLTGNANIEYKNMSKIEVPSDLNLHKKVFLRVYMARKASIYNIANNYFPRVDDAILGHTHGRAIPPDKYLKDHPEYFAVLGDKRIKPDSHNKAQYCYSNPEVRELLYQWHKKWLDMGFRSVNILQPDGFRGCQCEKCKKLFNTDDTDWAEKIWILHLNIAERLKKDHPDKKVMLTAYAFAREPPKTIKTFPDNVIIQNVDAIDHTTEIFQKWKDVHPGEFSCWSHDWCSNLATRFTPMRTPLFLENQAKWFYENNNRGIFRDGNAIVFGLEGPSYYIFGRMFDDPENLKASELMFEFCGAAFGESGGLMRRFYDKLNHAIELYSSYLGTHGIGWTYTDIYGRKHKHLQDPFRFLGFLYSPKLLEEMENDLSQAEEKAKDEKVKIRLTLVRREFDYLKSLMRVVHLYHAFKISPDLAVRESLLKAIDDRNALVSSYFFQEGRVKGRPKPVPGWDRLLFPPPGYSQMHMQLDFDSYQHPFKNTALNWDTDAVRKSPLLSSNRIKVDKVNQPLTLNSKEWKKAKSYTLGGLPVTSKPSKKTTLKMLYDTENLYVRIDSELSEKQKEFTALGEDAPLGKEESVDIYIAPVPGEEIYYRFMAGPNVDSKYDAASGLIKDQLNLLYGKDDKSWNGSWTYETEIRSKKNKWIAILKIPFKTMGVKQPAGGDCWRGNFGRIHQLEDNKLEKSIWSASGGTKGVGDRTYLGNMEFIGKVGGDSGSNSKKNRITSWREKYYTKTFDLPEEWKNLANPLPKPLGPWVFKLDQLERGVIEKWYETGVDESSWSPVKVPSFWAENDFGNHEGFGWYRTTFELPKDWQGKTLRIMFGSVDEQAWIYVNGKLVKEHSEQTEKIKSGNMWEIPFFVDVKPEFLKYGAENVLVVRVLNMKSNGGIWRPVVANAVETK